MEDLFDLDTDAAAAVDPLRFAHDSATATVNRWYHEAPPMQYLRELVYNGIEAGASRIELTPDLIGIDPDAPVYRLLYQDDGCGMSAEQLREFFAQLAKTGKSHERNHGIGVRVTTLPWNLAGLVVMSWCDGVGNMMRMRWRPTGPEPDEGHFGLHKFQVTEDDGTPGWYEIIEAPEEYKPPWVDQHGTSMLLLGNTGHEHTYFGPTGDPAEAPDMLDWLNRRLRTVPENVSISVTQFNNLKDRSRWPRRASDAVYGGDHANMRRRGVDGALEIFEQFTDETTRGVVDLGEGVQARWWLLSDTVETNGGQVSKRANQSRRYRNGIVGARYDLELYDVVEGSAPHARHRYGAFGIIMKKVVNRVAIVIEAPELAANAPAPASGFAVRPDSARGRLLVPRPTGHEELPWELWGERFAAAMPEVIEQAIRDAEEQDRAEDHGTLLRDRIRLYLKRLQSARWRRHEDGTDRSEDFSAQQAIAGQDEPVVGVRRRRRKGTCQRGVGAQDEAASRTTAEGEVVRSIRPRDPFPTPKWYSSEQFPTGIGARYVPVRNEVMLNRDHPVIAELVGSLASRYVNALGVRERIERHVRGYFDLDITTKVFHVLQHRGSEHFAASDIDEMLSERTLTTWLYGLAAAEEHLVTVVGKSLTGVKRLSA
jgi:hypothetical protein